MFARLSVLMAVLLVPTVLSAQGAPKIAVVNFEQAVVESAEGKKAAAEFNTKFEEHRTKIEGKQKEIADMENRLQTQQRALSEAAVADLTRNIQRGQTDLARMNEDAQRELGTYREELLRPISDAAAAILQAFAAEQGFTVIFDLSNPQTNIVFANEGLDITAEVTKRIDAALAQAARPAGQPAPAAPAARPPAAPAPAAPRPPAQ